ncbi:hypothetical protein [Maricaulis sp.]|nr:hypothetical protein [Maricaulis sp.]MDF1769848.1 hypothetical protein [Maricaulis sp.]
MIAQPLRPTPQQQKLAELAAKIAAAQAKMMEPELAKLAKVRTFH